MSPYLFEIYSEIFMNEMIHLGLVSKSGGIDETKLANNLGFWLEHLGAWWYS